MPPEFVPSERRKKRETPPPKEPRSVDDLVNDIMNKYREEQQKLGNVDNWGQPNEKLDRNKVEKWVRENLQKSNDNEKKVKQKAEGRFFPKAAAESLSEAIANKFRGTSDKGSEEAKQRKSSESRKTAQSTSERKAPEEKSPSKKEQKEQPRPKVDIRNPETRKEKSDPKNPQDDRKPLKIYKVKMYAPRIRGEEIGNERALKRYSNDELPGMRHLPNHNKMLSDAAAHIKLRELVGDRHELTLSEIRTLSEQTQLPFRTTRNYLADAGRPEYYRLAEKAITKFEAKSIIDDMHSRIGAIRNHSDVEKKLKENGSLEHLRSLSSYPKDDAMVHKYFKFIDALSEGGLMRDIARRVGVSEGTGISWTKGVLPLYIKKALETSDSSISRRSQGLGRQPQESTRETHPVSRINTTRPEINGIPIESDKHLKDIIAREYRGLMDMPGIDKILHEGCVHQQIINRLQGREYLEYGEVRRLAAEFNVKIGVVHIWTTKGVIPRIYFHINRSVSISEARKRIEEVSKRNNGVITLAEYERRMQNYYLHRYEQKASFNERENAIAAAYFRFLEKYQQGGSFVHIARQAGVAPSTALGWLEGNQPRRVRIASGIPREEPMPGCMWLPLRFRGGRYPEDSIQVPEHVKSYHDVLTVLRQIKSIENNHTRELQARLGSRSIEEEFMYLLGAYVSDAGIFNETTIGQSLGIRLATKYSWSIDFGEGFCQSLATCGIHAHRNKNTPATSTYKRTKDGIYKINQSEKLNWASENSPLVRWIHESCLGFNNRSPKREQQLSADWILSAPRFMRISFVQGWSDGDGSVSPRGRYFCITTTKNQKFASNLMASFGIDTRVNGIDVFTRGNENAIKAAETPMFRYASGREEASRKMISMIESTRSVRRNPFTHNELEFMVQQRKRGLSWFDIHEAMFDHFGTTAHRTTIENAVRKYSSGDPLLSSEMKKKKA